MNNKKGWFLILLTLFFSLRPLMAEKSSDTPKNVNSNGINEEIKKVKKTVEKEFGYKFPETPKDLAAIKKAVLVLIRASGDMKDIKMVRVYWKKTKLKDVDDSLKKGYLFLAVDEINKTADFGTFWEGQKISDVLDLGMKGSLVIENKQTKCKDCEGGLWSREFIKCAANRLLSEKSFDFSLKQ